jgi:hypothetical protein
MGIARQLHVRIIGGMAIHRSGIQMRSNILHQPGAEIIYPGLFESLIKLKIPDQLRFSGRHITIPP